MFLINRDSLGSYMEQMEEDQFLLLFVLYLLILDGVPGERVKMDHFSCVCSILTLNMKVCQEGCSHQEVASAVFIWDSLNFLPQEGHLKHRMSFQYFHAPTLCFKETVFIFHVSFHKLKKYTDPKHFILEYSNKGKQEPSYDFKSTGFLGFAYIK